MSTRGRVLVAMSGGVDSSVAALLLKEQGYEIIGAHMKLWDFVDVGGDIARDGRCCSLDSITDCRFVCDRIDAPFYVLNMSEIFQHEVIDNFISEYRAGRTPNPCVRCNSEIKWDAFLSKADELGCDFIATGHYSFVEQGDNQRWRIRKGVDTTRDQSYVLWGLSQAALARTLMPLGPLLKSEVRDIARKHDLTTANKTESREICFVADDDYHRFLREYGEKHNIDYEPGEIVHRDGRVIGEHHGTEFFTIGQRKGLGGGHPTPLYVQSIDSATRRVIVGDDQSLYANELTATDINWIAHEPTAGSSLTADTKIRYLHSPSRATVSLLTDASAQVIFEQRQRAITPGQSVVFYDGDIVLGGGLIQ